MLIFIDESGTHKNSGISIISFVYLLLKNDNSVERQIIAIEKRCGIKYFHWSNFGSKRGWSKRTKFLKEVSELDFSFKLSIADNPIKFKQFFENSFQHLIIENKIRKIVIDGRKPKWYGQRLKKTLRDKNISVKKIRMADDESSPGLRLADAVAGLYRSHSENPTIKTMQLTEIFNKKITAQLVDGQITK
jgi:hypothetical protein